MGSDLKRASEELLAALHGALAKELLDRIKSGEATAQDMANAIRLLKDNGITMDIDTSNSDANSDSILKDAAGETISSLPFPRLVSNLGKLVD